LTNEKKEARITPFGLILTGKIKKCKLLLLDNRLI